MLETLSNSEGALLWPLDAKATRPQKNPALSSPDQHMVQERGLEERVGAPVLELGGSPCHSYTRVLWASHFASQLRFPHPINKGLG